jgi:hypothetical protein
MTIHWKALEHFLVVPTWLLKKCLDEILPAIVLIVNKSMADGHVPSCHKFALVKPLLKKPSLDKEIFANYRPISNLTYISKLVERVVASPTGPYVCKWAVRQKSVGIS